MENGKRKHLRIKTRDLTSGKTHVKRTISEARRIAQRSQNGNRRGEHVAQTILYTGLSEEERDGRLKLSDAPASLPVKPLRLNSAIFRIFAYFK